MTPAKKPRRERSTGGLYQRKADGLWCASIDLPPGPDGRRRRKVITRKTQADALTALRAARRELERTGDLPTASPTLAQWLELWFTRIATPRLKPSTRPTYRSKIDRYIVPAIGGVRLDKLTPSHVRRLHDYITADPPEGCGLASSTALQAHRVLAKALVDAEREGRVTRNVATLVDAPRKGIVTVAHLDAGQARALLAHTLSQADSGPVAASEAARWAVALLTGMRPGERLGLTADQVDLNRRVITVSWQLQELAFEHGCGPRVLTGALSGTWPCGRKKGGYCPSRRLPVPPGQEVHQLDGILHLTRPKSRAGWRQVPMAPLLAEVLERYLAAVPPQVDPVTGHALVFTRPHGRRTRSDADRPRPILPSDDSSAWDAALRAAELPDVTRHSARHTTATLLDELGVPDNVRIQILGHSSPLVTAGYTHVADARGVEAMGRLGDLLALQPGEA